VEKYLDLLKDASGITEDRYIEVIGATESEDPKLRSAAYHLLGSIMNLDLLKKDRETFLEGFNAVLRADWDNEAEIRYTGVVILAKIMKPELLEKEEHLYMEGIDCLVRASCGPDLIVARKARDVIDLKKSQLEDTL
jgi:hypothetical protein